MGQKIQAIHKKSGKVQCFVYLKQETLQRAGIVEGEMVEIENLELGKILIRKVA